MAVMVVECLCVWHSLFFVNAVVHIIVGEIKVDILYNVQVRRGAGVMATVRRVGRELSRRLYTLMTSTDPQLIIR